VHRVFAALNIPFVLFTLHMNSTIMKYFDYRPWRL